MSYIPFNLRMYRILGRNRREPCKCGHFHTSKEVNLPPLPGDLVRFTVLGKNLWELYPDRYERNSPQGKIIIKVGGKRPKNDRTK